MTSSKTTISDRLVPPHEGRVEAVETATEWVLRPLSAGELKLLTESKREFSEGRSFSVAESRAQVDAVLAAHGVPRSV
jgi:hypothetical protein